MEGQGGVNSYAQILFALAAVITSVKAFYEVWKKQKGKRDARTREKIEVDD